MTVRIQQSEGRVDLTSRHSDTMNHASLDQLTPGWNLSRSGDSTPQPNMDAWMGIGTPGHDYLIGVSTRTDGHDGQLHNDMAKLENKLQELATDHQTEKDSRMSNEKRLTDTEGKIHGIFAQITKMDQDTVVDIQFLMHRLTQLEQAFDESLTSYYQLVQLLVQLFSTQIVYITFPNKA